MNLGISTSIFRGECLTRGHLEKVVRCGFRHVELTCASDRLDVTDRKQVNELAAALADLGLACPVVHGVDDFSLGLPDSPNRRALLDLIHRTLEAAARFGARTYIVHDRLQPGNPSTGICFRETLPLVISHAWPLGIQLAIEVIPPRCQVQTLSQLYGFVREFPADKVGICVDVNHANLEGADLFADLRAVSDRVIAFHLSDNDGMDERHWPPGKGVIDWGRLASMIKGIDRDIVPILEVRASLDDQEFLEAVSWVRGLLT